MNRAVAWSRRLSPGCWALLGLVLLGLGLRVGRACTADWYWDEGYLADLARDLGRFRAPQSGALWFHGVLPLTTSFLAPLTAAPFTWALSALMAVRLWAVAWGAASTVLLGLIGRRLGGWPLGLAAAALFALGPLPVALGGLGLYHHLGTALVLAAAWLALGPPDVEAQEWPAFLAAGLAAAACYWLWWAPLALCLRPAPRQARPWALRLGLGFGPLGLVLAWSLASGGMDAVAMWRGMLGFNYLAHYLGDLAHFDNFRPEHWRAMAEPMMVEGSASLGLFPAVWLGLAGLALVPAGKGRAWLWAGPLLGLADLFRQRGNLEGSVYALTPLLPWACLGLAALALRLGRGRWMALGLAALLLVPTRLTWIQRLSASPPLARNVSNFLRAQGCCSGSVVADPNVAWLLRGMAPTEELGQAAAWRGGRGGLLPAGLSPAAFSHDAGLEHAQFLVTSPMDLDGAYHAPQVALEGLIAEQQGWPRVFANPGFRVYANPRFGAKRDPGTRILGDPQLYRQAADEARADGHLDQAAFALARAATARLDGPEDGHGH